MMKFGALPFIGAAVAIQTKEGHDNHQHEEFRGVTESLGHWFHALMGDTGYVWDNEHQMYQIIHHLQDVREHENLHLETVHSEAVKIDEQGQKLEKQHQKAEQWKEKLVKKKKKINKRIKKYNKFVHKWSENINIWHHDRELQMIRDHRAQRINELLRFINDQLPMQQARLNEVCGALEKYVHNFENGATNWQPVNEAHMVEQMHKNCHMDVQQFEVGPQRIVYCVTRETDDGKKNDHCENLEHMQHEWQQHGQHDDGHH